MTDQPSDPPPSPRLMPCRLPAVRSREALEWKVLEDPRAQAAVLRQLREDAGLTVQGLATRLGVLEGEARQMELGGRKSIALAKFVRWVRACGGDVCVERGKR